MANIPTEDQPLRNESRPTQYLGNQQNQVFESVPLFWQVLLLLGAFCIAYNATNALHELGHVTCLNLTGGELRRVFVQPFSMNWTTWKENNAPLLMPWSGVVLGTFYALVISGLSLLIRSAWASPLHFLGVVAPAVNGLYVIYGVWSGTSNGAQIVQKGFSEASVTAAGLGLIAVGVFWAIGVQSLLGFRPNDTIQRRIGVLLLAVVPYLCALLVHVMLVPQTYFRPEPTALETETDELGTNMMFVNLDRRYVDSTPALRPFGGWFSYASGGTYAVIVLGALMHLGRRQSSKIKCFKPTNATRLQAGMVLTAGIIAVAVLEWFSPQVLP